MILSGGIVPDTHVGSVGSRKASYASYVFYVGAARQFRILVQGPWQMVVAAGGSEAYASRTGALPTEGSNR